MKTLILSSVMIGSVVLLALDAIQAVNSIL